MSITDSPQTVEKPCHAMRWRAATITCLVLMAIASATGVSLFEQFKAQIRHLQTQLNRTPQIRYIAVLLDAQAAPAMLVTFDPQDGALQIQRLNGVTEGRDDTLQLWALAAHGKPRSLGILTTAGKTPRLPASDQALTQITQLAISVENKGGVAPDAAPSLPYLFKGALVQKAL